MIGRVGTTRIRAFDPSAMRAAREAKGWSRGRLAVVLGVSPVAVAKWERGSSTPEPPRLRALAEALGIEPGTLLVTASSDWTLADYRVVRGLHQVDVTRDHQVTPTRLSSLELGYEAPRPDELDALAAAYDTTADELEAAWQRGRDRLLAD